MEKKEDTRFYPLPVRFTKTTYTTLKQVCEHRMRKRSFIVREILNEWAYHEKWRGSAPPVKPSQLIDRPVSITGVDKEIVKMIDVARIARGRSRSYLLNEIVTLWAEDIKPRMADIGPD